ncbi:Bromodomain-containing protein [Tothia fuscella]|uniref:Bromodomain-containing protein n=1 Tax=Tothia fuscella TaxID=1048955 RepID=A0A9P4P411_9PEZI|nr:Bromodomain-containing protein [Tothia fuscella]
MNSASKRKATAQPSGGDGERAEKRQKGHGDLACEVETYDTTTEIGLKFVETLKKAKDKTGRPIITEFLTLPDKKLYPAYYEATKLPISMETIEGKLNRKAYPNLSAVEGDLKRLVQNAKDFNDKKSSLYEDAERVRKTASNFMTRWNPAYKEVGYQAVATPIPGEGTNGGYSPAPRAVSNGINVRPTTLKISVPAATPARSSRRSAAVLEPEPEPEEEDVEDVVEEDEEEDAEGEADLGDFAGKTFQEAQEQIMDELIHYKEYVALLSMSIRSGTDSWNSDEFEIFLPFVTLPPRSLTHYYQLIKNPTSLKSVQKKVKGIHGKGAPSRVTDLTSWDMFEEEMSYIWKNAQEYNEDGSDIFNLANELKDVFHERLAVAKAQVEQPTQPTIKLKMSAAPKPSIKLKFGANKASPGAASPASTPGPERGTPGVIVHNEALERQRKMVAASMNGASAPTPAASRNPFSGSRSGSASTPIPPLTAHISVAPPPVQTNGVKSELHPSQSPALSAVRPSGSTSGGPVGLMQPPTNGATPQPLSGSPHPQLQPSLYPTRQGQQVQQPSSNHHYAPPQYVPPNGFVETTVRPFGQSAADSILPSLTISTHPALGLAKPFHLLIPAHDKRTQQSLTITVPSTHHFFHIIPSIPVAKSGRPYRIFVNVNGQRMSEYIKPGGERDKGRPVYEARCERGGVNRVEVEIMAGKGNLGKGGREEVDWERVKLFIHVLKA